MNGFIIASTESGSGKTLLSLGLMRALDRIKTVRPFKAGPDYIDPMFHRFALDRDSYNLDLILCGETRVRSLFYSRLGPDDIAVVEGVMGLYDGVEMDGSYSGSSADLARTIGLPVVLIVDARGKSRSIAALVNGFLEFESKEDSVKFAGIIINRVKSEAVYRLLKKQIEENCDTEVLGWIPEDARLTLKSRHLGLLLPEEIEGLSEKIDLIEEYMSEHVDLDLLIKNTVTEYKASGPFRERLLKREKDAYKGLRIAVALDSAFNFYYQDNLDLLKWLGVELKFFSPLKDETLPKDIDALYLGGGYPEVFFREIKENRKLQEEIKVKLEQGLPCYAECGGQLYLGESLQIQFRNIKMTGFLPVEFKLTDHLVHFGYAELTTDLFDHEYRFNIHEFHKSRAVKDLKSIQRFNLRKNNRKWKDGAVYKNVLFSYPHIHFYARPDGPRFLTDLLDYLLERKNDDHQ